MTSPAPVPEIPDNVRLYTVLSGASDYHFPAELLIVFEDETERTFVGRYLAPMSSQYKKTQDLFSLRSIVQKFYEDVKIPGMYRFNREVREWVKSQV